MAWRSGSTGEPTRRSGAGPLATAAVLGLFSAWVVHAGTRDVTAAPEHTPPPRCPVAVATRYLDLGTRWQHELVTASFEIENRSDRPVVLVSGVTSCARFAAFAAAGAGPEVAFSESRQVTVGAFGRCVVGARFTVRGAGEPERLELGCLAVAGAHSWPLRLTVDYRGEPAVALEPGALSVERGERLAAAKLRLLDGGAFAVVPRDPRPGLGAFAAPATPACREWSVGIMAGREPALRGANTLVLDVVTPARRRVQLDLPLYVAR